MDEFAKHVKASGRRDVVLHKTGCTGRCSKEPIVGITVPGRLPVKYERVNRELVHKIFTSHIQEGVPVVEHALDDSISAIHEMEFVFCEGQRCGTLGETSMKKVFREKLAGTVPNPASIKVSKVGCFGACSKQSAGQCVHVLMRPSNLMYHVTSVHDLDEIIESHVIGKQPMERILVKSHVVSKEFFEVYGDVAFFNRQSRIALRRSGVVDPESLDEYVHYNGFSALAKVLGKGDPKWVITELLKSKLRGRGGGGFLTGRKWEFATANEEKVRYIVCNGDEGDPGAFMDRGMLESDPFSVVEGMIIGGYAIGACKGFLYIRAEYPLAINRIQNAIDQCRTNGLLGVSVMDSDWSFDLEIRLGAGAFVCGEETALMLREGRRQTQSATHGRAGHSVRRDHQGRHVLPGQQPLPGHLRPGTGDHGG
jgi:(2Fe-2S) ferredoxin